MWHRKQLPSRPANTLRPRSGSPASTVSGETISLPVTLSDASGPGADTTQPAATPYTASQANPRMPPPDLDDQTVMPWFLSGSERMRLPVAAKIAFTSAGASGASGVSPVPPQKPPLGTSTASTFGISRMRIIG